VDKDVRSLKGRLAKFRIDLDNLLVKSNLAVAAEGRWAYKRGRPVQASDGGHPGGDTGSCSQERDGVSALLQ
jgi:hypothetical protein